MTETWETPAPVRATAGWGRATDGRVALTRNWVLAKGCNVAENDRIGVYSVTVKNALSLVW